MGSSTRINFPVVILLSSILFEAGLVANATGAVIPDVVRDLRLSYSGAALLPFTYFIAYALISVPTGILCERIAPKTVITAAFVIGLGGILSLAMFPRYTVVLGSLFAMGCWLAACQVLLFPLMRAACGGENLAFFTSLTTLMYGLGSILSPHLYAKLLGRLQTPGDQAWPIRAIATLVSDSYPWVSIYWVFAAIVFLTLAGLAAMRLPHPRLTEAERAGSLPVYLSLFRRKTVVLYALAVVCYCAAEQGCSNWLTEFLHSRHGVDSQTEGPRILSRYWLLLTSGCLGGMLAVKLFDTRRILLISTLLAAVSFSGAIFGGRNVSKLCFPLVGLFLSVLWPILVELALNSLDTHHGAMMGILMSSVAGGALGPFVIGRLADTFGLAAGMTFLYLPLLFIVYISLWARPLIGNATLFQGAAHSEHLV